MRNKLISSAIALALHANIANAGVYATTIHSRANCVNNESITWYLGHSNNWHVLSFHTFDSKKPTGYHVIDTGMSTTWRQAAVHWNESYPGGTYSVTGYHYYLSRGHEILDAKTQATDCNIYNGWWDY